MLYRISSTHLRTSIINQVYFSSLSLFHLKFHQSILSAFFTNSSTSSEKVSNTHLKSPPVLVPLVGKLVLSKYTHLLNPQSDNFNIAILSLNQLLLNISYVSPGICRKFLRVSCWKPEYMLEILLGFQLSRENLGSNVEVVKSLWEIFRRVDGGNVGFKHLPRSCEVMASMLINVGMFREVEYLLSTVKNQGIFVGNDEIFSGLIEGYVNLGLSERALLMYDKMKGLCLAPSLLCYRSLLGLLIEEGKVEQAICIYEDVVEVGFEFGDVESKNLESLIGFLCRDGKIREARKLLKKIVATGWKLSPVILSEVADVFYKKKDFEDLLSFFIEMKCAPDTLVGNKLIYSLCCNFNIRRANSFMWELENLGFIPNEITFGIFISWSCLDGKIKDAFAYLSEILFRGLKPDRHSYNALISSLLKAGMHVLAREILNEMIDNGIKPNLATYRAFLAGYSKARQFDEVKLMMSEMANHGLILLSPSENPISKAFSVLGLNPLTVKVKRDNDIKNFRTEYVDTLGNGLYLDTDVDEFEKNVMSVLEESLIPDFNLLVMRQCNLKNGKEALLMVDEMRQWGQDLSLPVLSALVRLLCESKCHIKEIPALLDKVFQLFVKLDHKTINFTAEVLSKNGFADQSRSLLHEMHKRHVPIFHATYTSTLVALCKLGSMSDILYCWGLAREDHWSPEWDDFIIVLDSLCQRKMLRELLEFFDIMLSSSPYLGIQICDVFLEKFSSAGFTDMGNILVTELKQKNVELHHSVYSHIIKGYCQEKRFSEALRTFDKFRADTLPLSQDALLLLIPTLCKVSRLKEAVASKDAVLKNHPSTFFSLHNALIIGCCRANIVAEAEGLFLEMLLENIYPNDEVINALLQAHCQSSGLRTAYELLCFMVKRKMSLSVSSYRDFLYLLCKKGMFHSAWSLKSLMLVENKSPYFIIHNIYIFQLFKTGKHFLVDAFLDELEESGLRLDEVGYNFLVHGFSVCKGMTKSIIFLNEMIMKGLKPSNRSLRAAIGYLCRNGQVQDALQLSNQMESRGWNVCPTVHYAILEGLFFDGRVHFAERYLARIMKKVITPETIYYNNLIRNFCRYGRVETAVSLLDQMLKKKSIPDRSSYDCIVQSFCGYDLLECAMDFFNEMLHRDLKPNIRTWDMIIQKLSKNGQTKEAENIMISMIEVGENPTKGMYTSVIDRYRMENNLFKASELMDRMQRQGYEPDFLTQWSLISSLSNSSDQKSNIGTEGFLSKLLGESGFPSESTKSKRK